MLKRIKDPMHFVGIGGIGMSGIAEVLFQLGFPISGSDIYESDTVKKLRSLGIQIQIGHRAENIHSSKVIVISSAIQKDNPELVEAKRLHLPIVSRAEMLAEIMRLKYGIAVAGAHGKTTTTSMIATILSYSGADPTIIVGGKVDTLGGNAKLGQGSLLVAEADESDGSFLKLSPVLNVITNIDNDHLDYYHNMEALRNAFIQFADKIPYYGQNILCGDDEEIKQILPLIQRPHLTYGFGTQNDFQLMHFKSTDIGCSFAVYKQSTKLFDVELSVPGKHNALNATAAIIVALECDLDVDKILDGIKSFKGVQRRFQLKGDVHGFTVIDDYGHHPTEIEATLKTAKDYWSKYNKKVYVAFQPHRYSRTQLCWNQFKKALSFADHIFLLDIYPAGEKPLQGVDSKIMANEFGFEYVGNIDECISIIKNKLQPGSLLLTMGAGNVHLIYQKLKNQK